MTVLNASGKLKRRRKKTKEDKIRDSATLIQAVFRGHQARKILRKHLHKKALENAISHEQDHREFGSILYELERRATVEEPLKRSAKAQAHLDALGSAAVHEVSGVNCRVNWGHRGSDGGGSGGAERDDEDEGSVAAWLLFSVHVLRKLRPRAFATGE